MQLALGRGEFTNAGVISIFERNGTPYAIASAIVNGGVVTNQGTISLDGGNGVRSTSKLVNSGSISQVAGGLAATGLRDVETIDNSGTISVAGTAIGYENLYRGTVTNSGTIASSAATTISSGSGLMIDNLAGGTISAAANRAAIVISGGTVTNAGTINGSVDLGYSVYGGRTYGSGTYISAGGTLNGSLIFGAGSDLFFQTGAASGVTGRIDGGDGFDLFGYSRSASDTIALGARPAINFEADYVEAVGPDTVVTLTAEGRLAQDVYVAGDGTVINRANSDASISAGYLYNIDLLKGALNKFVNEADISGGVKGSIAILSNKGTIGSNTVEDNSVVSQRATGALRFDNSGRILNAGDVGAVELYANDVTDLAAVNSGTIEGGIYVGSTLSGQDVPGSINVTNSGSISGRDEYALMVDVTAGYVYPFPGFPFPSYLDGRGSIAVTNSGTVSMTGDGGVALGLSSFGVATLDYAVANSGLISNTGSGITNTYTDWQGSTFASTTAAYGIRISGEGNLGKIVNAASGIIEATGQKATAIGALDGGALDLDNAGTIRGGAGTVLAADDSLGAALGQSYLAGAVQTTGSYDDRILNSGTIIGSIDLGAGNDRIENKGRIEGNVFLGAGDDSFVQHANATLIGTVDGGAGTDSLIVDATGGGSVNGDQFINFEQFSQIGTGNVVYSGNFRFDTIGLSGGGVTVNSGQTLSSAGAVTIAGGSSDEIVVNNGIIAGTIDLASGNDRVVNNGTVAGSVLLGAGDDRFVEGAGSHVAGIVDGGAGNDDYAVALSGDRNGIGQRVNFERLSVEGTGTLSLTLDQRFDAITLTGTGLNLSLGGFGVGRVNGSDGNETLAVDGDISGISLGGGNDRLTLGAARAAGLYMGGAGSDVLRFATTGPVTLAGTATGFEQVVLDGGFLTVTGALGTAGAPLSLGDGDQQLVIARGGTLAGLIDLGAGNDGFRLAAGSILTGSVSGGAGTDTATIETTGGRTLGGDMLRDFEVLQAEGRGTLSLTGAQAYDRMASDGDISIGMGATIGARQLQFGAGDQRLTIAGQFAGSVDGGAGNDAIAISGGTATSPVTFGTIANIETFGMSGGFATIAGSAVLGNVDMSGGRLVGLAGSTITASQIMVRQGATFGSAGTVSGNLTIAGTLSPGASPGTMTVNGNVALVGGSTSLFELTPGVSDKLIVNGGLSIASGATLEIVSAQGIRPGTSFDLIVASGGITGSYTTIVKPNSLFGFVIQRGDRIQLLGQFLGNPFFTPQVARSVDYANTAIVAQPATSTLFAALPSLLTASGASDPRAFAQLTPEPYASATQIGVENALTLTEVARGAAFGTDREDVGGFTFAQTIGNWRTLGADTAQGTAEARTSGYGFLGGIGIGNREWSAGAFGGYLDNRQRIDQLGARTKANGFVAGIHGRYARGGLGLTATILYDGGDAHTERALPGGVGAAGRYDLHGWVSDLSASYGLDTASGWSLRPKIGITYVRTTRGRVVEIGGPFALTVARDRHVAGFADSGFMFGRSDDSDAAFRPFVGLGVRYQIEGRRADALAGYAGAPLQLVALGASRAQLVGTASAGVSYRFANGLELFSQVAAQTGADDHQENIGTGLRFRF